MTDTRSSGYTTFDGPRRIASGSLAAAALAFKHAVERGAAGPVLIFDDASGRVVDVDTRGSDQDVMGRLADVPANAKPRGRGRPKLGVVAREVTLLPRHWEWLATQPGGASVALRKLVEEARRARSGQDRTRAAHERAYHFMAALAGDLPGFEEAARALFANNREGFENGIVNWPGDVRHHASRLGFGDGE